MPRHATTLDAPDLPIRVPAICTAGLAGSPERGPGEGAGRESVLLLGHNLCVASRLDEVADQLAQQPLAVRHGTSRLLARAEKRRGRIGIIAGVVGGVWMAVSTLRRYPRVPDQLATRRLYDPLCQPQLRRIEQSI